MISAQPLNSLIECKKQSCLGYISIIVKYKMFILCGDIGWGCRCATPWCCLNFTCVLSVVTLIFSLGYISETVRCRKLILGRVIGVAGVEVQHLVSPLTLALPE